MFLLTRIIALITIYGMPVQLLPTGPNSSGSTSPKSIRFPEHFFRQVYNKPVSGTQLKEIQYAPLHMDPKQIITTKKSVKLTTTTASSGKLNSGHLEPRTPESKNYHSKCYNQNPGERVDALPSVSRSPGHNAIYRSFPLLVPRDKPFKANKRSQDVVKKPMPMKKVLKKLNFIKPNAVPRHFDFLPGVSTIVPFHSFDRNSPPFMSNQQYIVNPDISDKGIDPVKPKRPPFSPYNKLHRIHLNIARVYSPGAVPQKLPSYSGAYSMNVDTEHAQLQADLPSILHLSKQRQDNNFITATKK